jgi:hypothetical protein
MRSFSNFFKSIQFEEIGKTANVIDLNYRKLSLRESHMNAASINQRLVLQKFVFRRLSFGFSVAISMKDQDAWLNGKQANSPGQFIKIQNINSLFFLLAGICKSHEGVEPSQGTPHRTGRRNLRAEGRAE